MYICDLNYTFYYMDILSKFNKYLYQYDFVTYLITLIILRFQRILENQSWITKLLNLLKSYLLFYKKYEWYITYKIKEDIISK